MTRSKIRTYFKSVLPLFEEGVGHKVGESFSLHGLILFQRVEVNFLLHQGREGLHIGAEAAQTHDDVVLHFEDSLEVVGESEHLLAESTVGGNAHTILADHAYQ